MTVQANTETPTNAQLTEVIDRMIAASDPEDHELLRFLLDGAKETRNLRQKITEMEENVTFLRALEAAGVDSWSGRDSAVSIYNQWQDES